LGYNVRIVPAKTEVQNPSRISRERKKDLRYLLIASYFCKNRWKTIQFLDLLQEGFDLAKSLKRDVKMDEMDKEWTRKEKKSRNLKST
jgi:hypothetical protein